MTQNNFGLSLGLAAALMAGGCGSPAPTAPPAQQDPPGAGAPPPPSAPTITGTVWDHAADGVKPFANQALFGWIETERGGYTTGRIGIDGAGKYRLSVPGEAIRVRIHVSGPHQPCAVTLTPQADVTRDVHVVSDPLQLGARLPPQLASTAPTLSGVVYEMTTGGRRPVKDVRVELDGLGGLGLVLATTLTDAEGRYVLCDVPHLPGLYLFATKSGYAMFETGANLIGQTTLDIELRRSGQ